MADLIRIYTRPQCIDSEKIKAALQEQNWTFTELSWDDHFADISTDLRLAGKITEPSDLVSPVIRAGGVWITSCEARRLWLK